MKFSSRSSRRGRFVCLCVFLLWGFIFPAPAWQMKQAPLMTQWASLIDTNNPLPEYPRPQMVRSNWTNLNGIWQFQPGTTNDPVPVGQTLASQILVPYPMESAISGVMQYSAFSWYRRTFTVPAAWSGKRVILHFDAVDWQASVYVNGTLIGVHKGGYDPFSYDVTSALNGGTNELILQVYSPEDAGGEPRGKQTLNPGGIMYTSASGIWQPVWMEPVDASGINTIQMIPDIDNGRLRLFVNTYLTNGVTVSATVLSNSTTVSTASGNPRAEIDLPVANASLWSPQNPFLYNLQINVVHSGVTNDSVTSYFGMRKISVVNVQGVPQIYLNNQSYFEMGPLDQGFWPDGIYTAPTDAALAYDIQMEKALSFNMVRKHIKVERQRWYYWADKLGILVWQDMPSGNSYTGSPQPIDPNQFIAELTAMVTNHWNSTAIVDWTIFNESQGQDGNGQTNTPYLVNLVQALDPNRLVNQASGGSYYGAGNILDNHSYPDPGAPISSTQATVDGEFGGIAWHVNGHLWNAALAGNGYLLASSLDNFATLYDGYLQEVVNDKDLSNGGLNAAIYTQITDVENECNGLMTYDRLVKPNMDRIYASNLKAITGRINSTTIIPTSESTPQTWQYTTNTPASNWYATNFNASSWSTGPAGFGTADPNATPNTTWNTPGYIYMRRNFNPGSLTPQQLTNLAFRNYHDEDVAIYINGVQAASASGYSTTYIYLPVNGQGQSAIIPNGTNLMAVSCHQTTGGQFIDVGISVEQLIASNNPPTQTVPVILQGPVSQSIATGGTASFSAQAIGGNLAYQWNFAGSPIPGATNNTFIMSNVPTNASGSYSIVVSNAAGTATNTVTLTVQQPPLTLLHRYSFVSDASDSIGGANGTLKAPSGGAAATINHGLILPGNTHGGYGYSGYVALPSGLLTATTNLTVECWVKQTQGNTWAEIWDFGNSGSQNFGLIPYPNNNGNNMEVAFTPAGGEVDLQSAVSFPNGTEQYVCLTYNSGTLVGNLYTNGALVASRTFPNNAYTPGTFGGVVGTTNNTLGNDVYGDDQFAGTIYEFRIWNGIVSPMYLLVSAATSPSTVATNLTPTSVSVLVPNGSMSGGATQQASAFGNFVGGATGLNVTSYVTNWFTSNTNILTINGNGLVTAVNPGTATVSATVNGTTGTSASITVLSTGPTITQEPPTTLTLLAGATLNVTVANIGSPPFVYRWYFDNNLYSVSASPTFTITNLQPINAGTYNFSVSNQYGFDSSTAMNLNVIGTTAYEKSLLSLNPIAYWPLRETGGTVAYDEVGGHNGTYVGGCTLAQSGPTNLMFDSPSESVLFDGTSGYVDIPGGPFNITGPITMVAWVNVVSVPTFAGIISHGDVSWRMSINGSGQPGASDGNATDATATGSIADGNWHMVAYTYNGAPGSTDGFLYVDGIQVANQSVNTTPVGTNLDVWIGGSPDYGTGRLLHAKIAHVAVFNQALTATQVQELNAGIYASPVSLGIQLSGTNAVLSWPAGTLMEAADARGPWQTVGSAVSPYSVTLGTNAQFFRILVHQ